MDDRLPSLEVLIATCGPDGGRKVASMLLPPMDGVSYLVSWQAPGESSIPGELSTRADVRVLTLAGLGLSRNRNNCLDNAEGDILLISDDDLELYPAGLQEIRRVFAENPTLDYGSFMYDSDFPKRYPSEESTLAKLPKDFFQTSFEIVLRRESKGGRLRFPENFGLGAERFTAGEEELLLKKARLNSLDCRFFPVKIANHPGPTTGVRATLADGTIRACGAVTVVEYPLTSILRIPLVSWRMWRARQAPLPKAFRLMLSGAIAAAFTPLVKPYLKSPLI